VAVNPRTDTIYVTGGFGNPGQPFALTVINGRANKVVATVRLPKAPAEVAVNPRTNTAYVVYAANKVAVIDGQTNKIVATVAVGAESGEARGIAADPRSNLIYVTNPNSDTVSVINGQTNKIVASVPVGRSPFTGIAVDPHTSTIYVANLFGNTVSVLAACRRPPASPNSAACQRH
jgi:YVTN family beta-propeller protein